MLHIQQFAENDFLQRISFLNLIWVWTNFISTVKRLLLQNTQSNVYYYKHTVKRVQLQTPNQTSIVINTQTNVFYYKHTVKRLL